MPPPPRSQSRGTSSARALGLNRGLCFYLQSGEMEVIILVDGRSSRKAKQTHAPLPWRKA